MARFFQYQAKTEAPLRASPATQQLSWFQAWSEPPVKTIIAPRLAIALMVSGLFAPITPQFFAGTGTAAASQIPVGIQYQQQIQYQAKTQPTPFPAQSSSYVYPWSEPVRFKRGLEAYLQDTGTPDVPLPPAVLSSQWFNPWSEPVRSRSFGTALQDVGTPDVPLPPPVLASQWFASWTDPTRRTGIGVQQQQSLSWSNFTPAAATTDTRWIYPWSEPTRRIGLNTALQDVGAPDVPNPPPVLSSQWIYGWSEPVRIKLGLAAQQQQTLAWNTTTPAAVVIAVSSVSPPVFFKGRMIYQSVAQPVFVAGDITNVGEWFEPWSEPVRTRQFATSQQQSLAWSTFTPAAAATTDTRWIYQWSEPVRLKRGLGPHLQPTIDNPPPFPIIPNPGTGTGIAVMQPSGIQYPYQFQYQAQALDPFPRPAVVVFNYGWFSPLSTPPSQKTTISSATFSFMAVDNALTNFWYAPWPDFTKAKTSILAAQQQTLAWANFTPAAVATTDIRWFQPWSEPARTRQFAAAQQQALAWGTFTPAAAVVPEDRWHQPWSEPVRLRRMPTADSVLPLIETIEPPTILVSQWFNPLSEPVRIKKGLLAALQQAQIDTVEFPTLPAGVVTDCSLSSPVFYRGRFIYQSYTKPYLPIAAAIIVSQWNSPWSTPTIPKITVSEADFGFAAVRPAVDVTVVLDATETNGDVALFGATVYNQAVRCSVSIREIPAIDRAAASVEEVPAINGAAASIEES